jgi:hypothetical protein
VVLRQPFIAPSYGPSSDSSKVSLFSHDAHCEADARQVAE